MNICNTLPVPENLVRCPSQGVLAGIFHAITIHVWGFSNILITRKIPAAARDLDVTLEHLRHRHVSEDTLSPYRVQHYGATYKDDTKLFSRTRPLSLTFSATYSKSRVWFDYKNFGI